jgi:hypothetical protein
MAKFVKPVVYLGCEILYVDCAGQNETSVLAAFDEMLQAVFDRPIPARCLVLLNMKNTPSSLAINNKGREIVEKSKARGVAELPTAIFGFGGAQKMVARMFLAMRRDDTLFIADDEEHAKAWLVSKAKK